MSQARIRRSSLRANLSVTGPSNPRISRTVHAFVSELVTELGGVDRLTAAQVGLIATLRVLVRNALIIESIDTSNTDAGTATKLGRSSATLANSIRHVLKDLGMAPRKPVEVPAKIRGIEDLIALSRQDLVPQRRAR